MIPALESVKQRGCFGFEANLGYLLSCGPALATGQDPVYKTSLAWWCTPLILPFRKQRQMILCEFEASVVYIESPKIARNTFRDPITNKQTN